MTSQSNGPSVGDTSQTSATLAKRRKKLQAAQSVAETKASAVKVLDERVHGSDLQRETQEAALTVAIDKVAALKKATKASARQNERVRAERKKARRSAAKAAERAATAEGRYDDAVLADMLQHQKEIDLAAHAGDKPIGPSVGRLGSKRTGGIAAESAPTSGIAPQV